MPILFFVAWAFTFVTVCVWLKYFAVCALALTLCFVLARAVLIQLPSF